VPLSEMHFRHPLPGQIKFGQRTERDQRFDGIRAPSWWTSKFPVNSDAIFVDDDIRLLAVEDDGYNYLVTNILKSKYFEAAGRDAFNAFSIADVFSRDKRVRQFNIEEPSSLLKVTTQAISSLWKSAVFGDKGRNATSLIGEDDFVMSLVLLHSIEGTRSSFLNADGFLALLKTVFKAAALAKFASLCNDDDEMQVISRWAGEQAANKARQLEQSAKEQQVRKEQERLENLKKSNPSKYQEALADAAVVAKAAKLVEDQEKKEKIERELLAKKQQQKLREDAASELALQAIKQKRAKIDELNELAETDPAAYEVAIKEQERRVAEAAAAGRVLGPDGEPLLDENSVSGRRQLAMRMIGVRLLKHANAFRHLQDQRRRLRLRLSPIFSLSSAEEM
jgi:hypothetical protein